MLLLNERLKFFSFLYNIGDGLGIWRKIYAGLSAVYEGVLAKYLYDLNAVLSDPIVQSTVVKGKLPNAPHVRADLFPWPTLYKTVIENPYSDLPILFTREMQWTEHVAKYFHDNPFLQGLAISLPFIFAGIYCGIKRYRRKNEK